MLTYNSKLSIGLDVVLGEARLENRETLAKELDEVKPTHVLISEDKLEVALRCANTPVDTTGAGDSFNGAYLAARFNGQDAITAVQKAQAISSKVVMHRGALVSHEILMDAFKENEITNVSESGT